MNTLGEDLLQSLNEALAHVAMDLLKREKTKISYRKKRIRAAMNDTFRDNLLMGQ